MEKAVFNLYKTLREKGIIKSKPEYEEMINKSQEQDEHDRKYQEWKDNMDTGERKIFENVFE